MVILYLGTYNGNPGQDAEKNHKLHRTSSANYMEESVNYEEKIANYLEI